jgi:hypothetical protein
MPPVHRGPLSSRKRRFTYGNSKIATYAVVLIGPSASGEARGPNQLDPTEYEGTYLRGRLRVSMRRFLGVHRTSVPTTLRDRQAKQLNRERVIGSLEQEFVRRNFPCGLVAGGRSHVTQ